MLLAFTAGFAMSQAFRTVAAILAPPLQRDFGLTPGELGLFAGAFHFSFGALQLFMGLGIDVWGTRRTMLAVFPLAIVGALLASVAQGFGGLVAGQVLIGIGCAPAFVVCTVFVATRYPAERFAALSGLVMGLGGAGLLLTGTPLAWVVEQWSWRTGFQALAVGAALAWLAVLLLVREAPEPPGGRTRPGVLAALRGYGALFTLAHTWGIVALALVTYAAFLALRGLWLGPLLVDRHGFGLVASGHVALAVSVVGMFGPPLFGRIDPGERLRRRWIAIGTLSVAAMYAVLAFSRSAAIDVGLSVVMSLVAGYIILQYADVKSAYPAHMTGRAMAVFTMAMFLGVAFVQWLTGLAASVATAQGWDPYAWVFGLVTLLLLAGTWAFVALPAPRR
ncbi:MFS transporter [Ramlibacter sp. AN1015]|uniref:MFS transporter n=1 Tax=Ramlibacter sp. AN1015 TaxID=3133428 RepID=UPI0030C2BD5A